VVVRSFCDKCAIRGKLHALPVPGDLYDAEEVMTANVTMWAFANRKRLTVAQRSLAATTSMQAREVPQ
jgi:hypothetical protein